MSPMNTTSIFLALTIISAILDNCPLLEPASSKDNLACSLNFSLAGSGTPPSNTYQTGELEGNFRDETGVKTLKLTQTQGTGGNIDESNVLIYFGVVGSTGVSNLTGSIPQPLEAGKPVKGKFKKELKVGDFITLGTNPGVNYQVTSSGGFIEGDFEGTIDSVTTQPTDAKVTGILKNGTISKGVQLTVAPNVYIVDEVSFSAPNDARYPPMTLGDIANHTSGASVPGTFKIDCTAYRRQDCSGKSMLFVEGVFSRADVALLLKAKATLELTLNPDCPVCAPFVPVIYGVLASSPEMVQTASADILTFTIPLPANNQPIIFCIAELGYATSGTYKYVDPNLDVEITSDLFSRNPVTGTILDYDGDKNFTASPTLSTNRRIILARLRNRLRDAAILACISARQLEQMAFTAFNNEIASYFRCEPYTIKNICCNSVFPAYAEFITSTLSLITGCAESSSELILRPWGRETDNPSWALNREICKVASQSHFNDQISALFSELVYPDWRPQLSL